MQNGQKTKINTRRHTSVAPVTSRSMRWTSDVVRHEPRGSQNAQNSYDRYIALAQAEAQVGDIVGAENYYQHAEHYFRSMSSGGEAS